jgi:predicted ATPase
VPLREQFRAQHMVALYRCGRHPEALRAFQRFRSELGNELGLEPSPALVRLEEQMLRHDTSLDMPTVDDKESTRIDSTHSTVSTRHASAALPLPLTTFVGRESDVFEAGLLLESVRMLTLSGPAGVGKTRLALRIAEESADRYADGVWICDLATIREPSLATDAITTALDVQRRQDRSALESLVDVLQPRRLLVVFDSCEHLLPSLGAVAETLLRRCPGVSILATSREPLAVDGETVRLVHPLPLPDARETDPIRSLQSPAVGLFVDRATSSRQGSVSPPRRCRPSSRSAAPRRCPARSSSPRSVRSMALADVAAGLDERFTLLTAGRRAEPRHQTLLAAVEWSHDLLDPVEQAVFRRLSVFAATFTLDDVEHVSTDGSLTAADARAVLPALVDKSMIVADTTVSPTRYSILETLRAFGHQLLAREDTDRALERRHAAYFVERVASARVGLSGPDESRWADLLDDAFDDLRVAHRWATVHGDVDAAFQLVAGAHEFAFRRMRYELFTWSETALAMQRDDEHPLGPLVLAIAAYGRFVRGTSCSHGHGRTLTRLGTTSRPAPLWPPLARHRQRLYPSQTRRPRHASGWCAARASRDDARLVHALYMTAVGLVCRNNDRATCWRGSAEPANRISNPATARHLRPRDHTGG